MVSLTIFFILYYAYRRRLANRANLAHIQQTQRESRAAYGGPYGSAGGLSPFSPQRPTPVHNDFNTPYIYNAATPVREISLTPGPLASLTLFCRLLSRRRSTIIRHLEHPQLHYRSNTLWGGFEGCKVSPFG